MATTVTTDGDVDRSVPHGEEAVLTVRGLASRRARRFAAASGRGPTAPCPPTRRRPAA
jgi:hypothetical protein